ncbi:hypothetical protein BDW68DRAFT_151674, partial [Aspergillus falconensis]
MLLYYSVSFSWLSLGIVHRRAGGIWFFSGSGSRLDPSWLSLSCMACQLRNTYLNSLLCINTRIMAVYMVQENNDLRGYG